jgi:hypothetical protein
MVEASESLLRTDLTPSYRANPAVRRPLPESKMKMCAVFMVVTNILREQSLQMAFVHRDDVVQQVCWAASDQTLRHTVGMSVQLRRMAMLKFDVSE